MPGGHLLTFEDLLAAKVAIQLGAIGTEAARASLAAALRNGRTLAQELEAAGTVDPGRARTIALHARRCSFLKAESTYLASLRRRGGVDEKVVEKVRARQHAENLRFRLGDLLVQEGAITKEVNDELTAEARRAFLTDNAQVTERYVQRNFEGIERHSVTVAEVIAAAQAAGGAQPATPGDFKVPGMTPPSSMPRPVPARAAAHPASPPPPTTAPDMADDLGALGHSAEAPAFPFPPPGMGEPIPQAMPRPAAHLAAVATAAPPAASSPLAGTGLETKYDVLKKLGEGGMGAVYLVRERDGGREAALKLVLDREKSQEAAKRFKREILATSMCAHENVIEIFDAGETKDGSYYMAMEYVPGEELADIVKRQGAIPLPRALDLYEQILEGIGAVHDAGIVHRDLKPQNFRVYKDPATGRERVKIMDFGIARIRDQAAQFADQFYKTMGGKITGSPAYIAPESITEPEVDGRADLYSLGIALFRMITGKLPFQCKDPMEYLPKHLYAKPPVPSEFNPALGIPKELDAVVAKLLAKNADLRFQKAEEVLAEIRTNVRPKLAGAAPPQPAPRAAPQAAPVDVLASSEATSKMPGLPASVVPATIAVAPPPDHGVDVNAVTLPAPGSEGALVAAPRPRPAADGPKAPVAGEKPRGCLGFLFGRKKQT